MKNEVKSFNKKNKSEVAKAIALLHDKKNKIPDYIIKSAQDRLLWIATENDDNGKKTKYEGQPYWSIGALNQYSANKNMNGLRHEHSIPRKILHKKIDESDKEFSSINEILNHFAHAVIVTKDEDIKLTKEGLGMKMPGVIKLKNNSDIDIVFSRYKEVGIKVYDIRKHLGEDNISIKKLSEGNFEVIKKNALT